MSKIQPKLSGPFSRNMFSGFPIEYTIPSNVKVVVVSDFFSSDVTGGAELTTEAILEYTPTTIARRHSMSVTTDMIDANHDKTWIFFNFAMLKPEVMQYLHFLSTNKDKVDLRYYIVEFDYKYCKFRSAYKHLLETKQACDCNESLHGKGIIEFYMGAKKLFWMSQAQKDKYQSLFPSTFREDNSMVLSSVFDERTITTISKLREKYKTNKQDKLCILGSGGSWIKGSEQTEAWCKLTKKDYVKLDKMPYDKFLEELVKYKTFVFRPLDLDTCPRVAIEAKLLGCELLLNDNVQHKNEQWFNSSIEEIETYLKSRPAEFWKQIEI